MLNRLYEEAQELRAELMSRGFNCRLVDAKGNYLFVDGKYERQLYAIPVIEIKGCGDVGFNIDGPFFEFSFSRTEMSRIDFEALTNRFRVEVYDSETSMIDLYSKGDSLRTVLDKAGFSEVSQMMLSVYVGKSQVSLLINLLFVLQSTNRLPHHRKA